MVSGPAFTKIRKKYEDKIINLMTDLDSSGYNAEQYKNTFKSMSDKEFVNLMKKMHSIDDFNLSIDVNQLESEKEGGLTLEKVKNIAQKYKIKLTEFVFMPFRNPNGQPMCTLTEVPIIYVPIRRFFQQMLQHKNSISNDNSRINPITGQVIQEDKTASTTNVQTYALSVTNQHNALKEFLGPRADDPVSKQQMLTSIEQTGDVSINDLNIETHNKQAINTVEVFCKAAGLDVKFAGNDVGFKFDDI